MMTRAVWIDTARQTDAINRILQIEGSFDSLHDGMSRDRFISEAAEIAKRLGYNDIKQLRSNGQLQDKIASWNTYNSKLSAR